MRVFCFLEYLLDPKIVFPGFYENVHPSTHPVRRVFIRTFRAHSARHNKWTLFFQRK